MEETKYRVTREGDNVLAHHGIKGMKWGVRRFQDGNGRLTAAGRKRYSVGARKLTDTPAKPAKYFTPLHDRIASGLGSVLTTAGGLATFIPIPEIAIPGGIAFTAGIAIMVTTSIADSIHRGAQQKKDFVKADGPIEKVSEMKRLAHPEDPEDSVHKVNRKPPYPDSGFDRNCVSCSVAMDMRHKGYDVFARRQHKGLTNGEIHDLYKRATVKQIGKVDDNTSPQGLYNKAEKMIAKDNKGNSSGLLTMQWYGGGGHCVYYQCKNGHLELFDGQTGDSKQSTDSYFQNCYELKYMRTDNKQMEEKVGECVVSNREKKRR